MDSDSERNTKAEAELEEFVSFVTEITFLASSTDWDSEVASLFTQLFSAYISKGTKRNMISYLFKQIHSLKPKMTLISLGNHMVRLWLSKVFDSKWTVIVSLVTQIMFLVSSMDLDLPQPKPESKLISLVKQVISLFNSKPDSESELVQIITQIMCLGISVDSNSERTQESELLSLIGQLVSLKPEPEVASLIRQIISRFLFMNWEPKQLLSLCPQVMVKLVQGKYQVTGEVQPTKMQKGECDLLNDGLFRTTGKEYFYCQQCRGEYHEGFEKAPLEVKHSLHPKHFLKLVIKDDTWGTRECYCCDKDLEEIFYYCSACDFAMNISCLERPPFLLAIDHPKWHEHALALFPSQTSFPCNLCALTHSTRCPFYVCPPCDFVVHHSCLRLPRVIKISRHPHHRISFTHSFNQGDWNCGVCRKKIENDYGGYSCIKDGCTYAAHAKCATQSNVWDGEELEGEPEEVEEEYVQPYVWICDGVICHFSHPQHHLRLDKNTGRDYDDNKLCQACTTPIYFGNFYSCIECEFIIHEICANLSRKIYHPVHPHMLSLVTENRKDVCMLGGCEVCPRFCSSFFYQCGRKECHRFKLHVQCVTVSEPLVHESHPHPLFLTSKPGECGRTCGVCKDSGKVYLEETFNCIECEFSVCFGCATIPQKARYKHDKHMLTLSYGNETSTEDEWCETCETKIKPEEGFYKCDEYCCVTIHIECLLGDFYLKPGLLLVNRLFGVSIDVLPNHRMFRPICSKCKNRCPRKLVFGISGSIFCSRSCFTNYLHEKSEAEMLSCRKILFQSV